MAYIIAFIIPIILVAIFIFVLKIKNSNKSGSGNDKKEDNEKIFDCYQKNEAILSPAEYSFYKNLMQSIPEDKIVIIKTRLADLFSVKKGTPNWKSKFNKIAMKHFDFIILDKTSSNPIFAIELDDSSHNKESDNDEFKNAICKACNFKIVRVKAAKGYTAQEILAIFK